MDFFMATMLEWHDKYVELGLKPIPVYKEAKNPAGGRAWYEGWTPDRYRSYFHTDAYNMGIILGDIIDVEGDTEEANDLLLRMIDGLPHPMFRSRKSIHHLFQSPDPSFQWIGVNGIEFRGAKHQSVVPPSLQEEGVQYQWVRGSQFPAPLMPEELLRFFLANKEIRDAKTPYHRQFRKLRNRKKGGHTRTVCKICNNGFYIHEKRLMLEVRAFREYYNLPWMCHGCREFDMRELCRTVRKGLEVKPVLLLKDDA